MDSNAVQTLIPTASDFSLMIALLALVIILWIRP